VPALPRIRQAVLAVRDLDSVAGGLRDALGLGRAFADPGVDYFGLRNSVFALGDTFLEVVSPVREDTAAGRMLERRRGDCGYMTMFQVDDLASARERVSARGIREVFEVQLEDIGEVHLHPADMRGAIVSLSQPVPDSAWRWGGPGWLERSVPGRIAGATIGVRDPDAVAQRWSEVIGGLPGVEFTADDGERGLIEIKIATPKPRPSLRLGGVRFVFEEGP
jgi:hypothetical protein